MDEKRMVPPPPGLHWGFVLILSWITAGLFGVLWLVVLANWANKVRPGKALLFAWLAVGTSVIVSGADLAVKLGATKLAVLTTGVMGDSLWAADFACYVAAIFVLRSELQRESIVLGLGPVMTFFLGPVYFQYFLMDHKQPIEV